MKSVWKSKTIHFNLWSGIMIPAIWPLLPQHFRDQPYAQSALTAWFAAGNIVLRFVTHEALTWSQHEDIPDR